MPLQPRYWTSQSLDFLCKEWYCLPQRVNYKITFVKAPPFNRYLTRKNRIWIEIINLQHGALEIQLISQGQDTEGVDLLWILVSVLVGFTPTVSIAKEACNSLHLRRNGVGKKTDNLDSSKSVSTNTLSFTGLGPNASCIPCAKNPALGPTAYSSWSFLAWCSATRSQLPQTEKQYELLPQTGCFVEQILLWSLLH